LFLWSCKTKPTEEPVFAEKFSKEKLELALEELCTEPSSWNKIYPDLRFGDTLSKFYASSNYASIWASLIPDNDYKILEVFHEARLDGLYPAFYQYDTLLQLASDCSKGFNTSWYKKLAWMELVISDHLLSFHRDRVVGRTEPDSIFREAYQLPRREYPSFELMSVLDAKEYKKILMYNSHSEKAYGQYAKLLATYYEKADKGEDWFSIDTTGITKIEPGDTTELMPAIMKKLYVMGMVEEGDVLKADSVYYNEEIEGPIKLVQEQFGLLDDGILGTNTIALINTTLEDRINQISACMERIRWFEIKEEEPFVVVNLPAFELSLHYIDSIASMRVCIGKARPPSYQKQYDKYLKTGKWFDKPRDFETPQVASKIHYAVINPTWTVPKSIITREMFHQMRRDSLYLIKNGYGLYYKGKELRSDTIKWSKYAADKVPFTIVQQAGDANALGKVKYIFPNPFNVYLHDTPQRSKFKWTERAVSHGCVRVEDPLKLGEFLMQNHAKFDSDDFRILMGYPPLDEERLKDWDPQDSTAEIQKLDSTDIIRLKTPVPVYFVYNTIWFDEEGIPQYRRDVYDKNKMIIEAMRKPEKFRF
jgi:murein L,D-transpeptidase YcbB/YkuD